MLNTVSIMGRLVKDPELKTTKSGVSTASFTIAVERDYKGKDDAERQSDFFDCIAWRQTAEFVNKYFSKGNLIVINGKLQTETWEAQDGTKRKKTSIVADNVYFGGGKPSGDGGQSNSRAHQISAADDSDFPF